MTSDVRDVVRAELARLKHHEPDAAPVSDGDALNELGVGSLDLLELTDTLETALHVNPFDQGASFKDVRTVADLCAVYEAAIDGRPPASESDDDLLRSSRKRAEARRRPRAV